MLSHELPTGVYGAMIPSSRNHCTESYDSYSDKVSDISTMGKGQMEVDDVEDDTLPLLVMRTPPKTKNKSQPGVSIFRKL